MKTRHKEQDKKVNNYEGLCFHTPIVAVLNATSQSFRLKETTEKEITLSLGMQTRNKDVALIILPTTLFGENFLTTFLNPENEIETLLTSEKESVRALGMFLKAISTERSNNEDSPPF